MFPNIKLTENTILAISTLRDKLDNRKKFIEKSVNRRRSSHQSEALLLMSSD